MQSINNVTLQIKKPPRKHNSSANGIVLGSGEKPAHHWPCGEKLLDRASEIMCFSEDHSFHRIGVMVKNSVIMKWMNVCSYNMQ